MKISVEMPNVLDCDVTECAYNADGECHARAITIGGGIHPACDTYFPSGRHVRELHQTAGVGACKVSQCEHNRDLECQADAIRIGHHETHADCMTFTRR